MKRPISITLTILSLLLVLGLLGLWLPASPPGGQLPALQGEAALNHLKEQGLYGSLQEAVAAARYGFYQEPKQSGDWLAYNPAHRLRARFTLDGLQVITGGDEGRSHRLGMKLRSAGYGGLLSESHVATGKTALICMQDMLRCLEHYWGDRRDDPEISALLGFRQLDIARIALDRCERATALEYLKSARRDYPRLRRARYLQWLITSIPGERFSCQVYIGINKAVYILRMIRRNEMSISGAIRKLARRLFNMSLETHFTAEAQRTLRSRREK